MKRIEASTCATTSRGLVRRSEKEGMTPSTKAPIGTEMDNDGEDCGRVTKTRAGPSDGQPFALRLTSSERLNATDDQDTVY